MSSIPQLGCNEGGTAANAINYATKCKQAKTRWLETGIDIEAWLCVASNYSEYNTIRRNVQPNCGVQAPSLSRITRGGTNGRDLNWSAEMLVDSRVRPSLPRSWAVIHKERTAVAGE